MSKKSELQSAIDTVLANGQTMPISKLRGLLKDDSVNLLDNVYCDYNSDNHGLQNFITLGVDGSCKYDLLWGKQGRKVYVTIRVYEITQEFSLLGNLNIEETHPPLFLYANFLGEPSSYCTAYVVNANNSTTTSEAKIKANSANGGQIYLNPSAKIGQTIYITFFYNTKN